MPQINSELQYDICDKDYSNQNQYKKLIKSPVQCQCEQMEFLAKHIIKVLTINEYIFCLMTSSFTKQHTDLKGT